MKPDGRWAKGRLARSGRRQLGRTRRASVLVRRALVPPGRGTVYVFHHIPKTGGSTVNRALGQWFHRVRDYPDRIDPEDWDAGHVYGPPLDLNRLRAGDCLSGHWSRPGDYLYERYPQVLRSGRFRVFTLVRHPLQARLSLLAWVRKMSDEHISSEEILLSKPNHLSRRFGPPGRTPAQVLGRYFFVGLTGRMQLTLDRLADLLGKWSIRAEHANRSRWGSSSEDLPDALVREFEARNPEDYALWRWARRRFVEYGGLRALKSGP